MMRPGFKKFVCRSLLALLPVAAYVVLYLALDPFGVVHRYNGVSIAPGDTLERIPNKRYVAIEGYKIFNPEQHYDSFIFGSSISSNFTAAAWKKHLPDTASVYHFTAGAQTLTGIRDELSYLLEHGANVRHAMIVMEQEMFHRPKRYEEMPYVPHYDVSDEVSWVHFQRVHFNAFRDPYIFLYNIWPTDRIADKLLADGKMQPIPSGRDELLNEDSSKGLDTMILGDPDKYYADWQWLADLKPFPNPLPLDIDESNVGVLSDIARLLQNGGVDYMVIVPPRYQTPPLAAADHVALCDIMGAEHVYDWSGDSLLIHDLRSYYDGVHLLTFRCTELIDRCFSRGKTVF